MLLQVPPTVALDAVAKVGIVAALTVTILQGIKKLSPNISGWWAVAFNILLSFGITLVAALTSTPPPSISSLPLLIGSALASAMSASGLHSLARPNAPPLVGTAPANDTGLNPASTFTASSASSAPFAPQRVAHSTQVGSVGEKPSAPDNLVLPNPVAMPGSVVWDGPYRQSIKFASTQKRP